MFVLQLQGFHNNKEAEWPLIPLQGIKIVKFNVVITMTKCFLFTIQRHFYAKKLHQSIQERYILIPINFQLFYTCPWCQDQFIFLKCK